MHTTVDVPGPRAALVNQNIRVPPRISRRGRGHWNQNIRVPPRIRRKGQSGAERAGREGRAERAGEGKEEGEKGRRGGPRDLHATRRSAVDPEKNRNRARSLPSPCRTKLTVGRLCGRRSSNVDCDRGEDFFSPNIEGALSEGPAQTRESKVST